jgi:hypothetical protein
LTLLIIEDALALAWVARISALMQRIRNMRGRNPLAGFIALALS